MGIIMRAGCLVTAVSLMVLTMMPMVSADNDPLKVVLTIEEEEFAINSTIHFKVHVFYRGEPEDPDEPPWVRFGSMGRNNISVTRMGKGIYSGEAKLIPELVGGDELVTLWASATKGKEGAEDKVYDMNADPVTLLVMGIGVNVECEIVSLSDSVVKVGTKAVFRARVMKHGVLFDPDSFVFTLFYKNSSRNNVEVEMSHEKISVGRYETTLTVPDAGGDTVFTVTGEARDNYQDFSGSASIFYDPLTVIYHMVDRKVFDEVSSQYLTRFDLYVGDGNGEVVEGARFDLEYYPNSNMYDAKYLEDIEPTGPDGRTRVEIPLTDRIRDIFVKGKVTSGGTIQSLGGTIFIKVPTPSTGTGGYIEPDERPEPRGGYHSFCAQHSSGSGGQTYGSGEKVTRKLWVYNDSIPWANKEVYVYILSGTNPDYTYSWMYLRKSVEARKMMTDGSGRLNITVQTEKDKDVDHRIHIVSATGSHPTLEQRFNHESNDGLYYNKAEDYFYTRKEGSSPMTGVEIGDVKAGETVKITYPAEDGDPDIAVAQWFVNVYAEGEEYGEWSVWAGPYSYLTKKDGKFEGSFMVPSFMPSDMDYLVRTEVLTGKEPRSAYSIPVGGEGVDDDPNNGRSPLCYICCGAAILIILVIAVVVAIMVISKKRNNDEEPRTSEVEMKDHITAGDGIGMEGGKENDPHPKVDDANDQDKDQEDRVDDVLNKEIEE